MKLRVWVVVGALTVCASAQEASPQQEEQKTAQGEPEEQQAVPSIDPGEQEGFDFIIRQRAFPMDRVPAGVADKALRDLEVMRRTRPAARTSNHSVEVAA